MPKQVRHKTKYPGVYYIMGASPATGKAEKIFYIRYRKDGKQIDEKVGRQIEDDMTPARASNIRSEKIKGHEKPNREIREDIKKQKEAEANRWTFDSLWESYKKTHPNLKGVDIDEYRYKKHISPIFGIKEPKELSPFEVDKLRIRLPKSYKPASVKLTLELIRRLSNYAEKKQLCDGLSFTIQMPTFDNEKTEDLTPEQLNRLLEAIEQDHNIQAKNLMKMALFTGMRRGELFGLKWQDLDFDRGFIYIRNPKSGQDKKIPLSDTAKEILKKHPKTSSEFVFPGQNGKQRVDIRQPVNRIKKRAGLPQDFRPIHGLRHVYASMLASSGKVDMYTLQKLMTHKSPTMTQRYAHLRDEALIRASNLAGSIIDQVTKKDEEEKQVVSIADYKK